MSSTPGAPRPALRVADIVVGALIALFGAFVAVILITLIVSAAGSGRATCATEGCDSGPLTAIMVVALIVVIFGWALTFGFFIVRAIKGKLSFFLPIIGFVVIVLGYYGFAAGAGAWANSIGVIP